MELLFSLLFFFFNDTATTEIYTLSLHDALPISADTMRVSFVAPSVAFAHAREGKMKNWSKIALGTLAVLLSFCILGGVFLWYSGVGDSIRSFAGGISQIGRAHV